MDKIKIGFPRALFYYHYADLVINFFNNLGCQVIISPESNKKIYQRGSEIAQDEMCSALKLYFGHIDFLKNKVDYILIPRIDNYGIDNQMCTNFMALYDITRNLFDTKILEFNIEYTIGQTEYKGLYKIAKYLGYNKKDIKSSYIKTMKYIKNINKIRINNNYHQMLSKKKKILIVGHPYMTYDNLLGQQIIEILKSNNIEIIYSDKVNREIANKESKKISHTNYFKFSKEILGSINLVNKYIDGIIFISSFPCAIDSIANELAIRKTKKPTLNIIIDDVNSIVGLETRIESFIDLIERKTIC